MAPPTSGIGNVIANSDLVEMAMAYSCSRVLGSAEETAPQLFRLIAVHPAGKEMGIVEARPVQG